MESNPIELAMEDGVDSATDSEDEEGEDRDEREDDLDAAAVGLEEPEVDEEDDDGAEDDEEEEKVARGTGCDALLLRRRRFRGSPESLKSPDEEAAEDEELVVLLAKAADEAAAAAGVAAAEEEEEEEEAAEGVGALVWKGEFEDITPRILDSSNSLKCTSPHAMVVAGDISKGLIGVPLPSSGDAADKAGDATLSIPRISCADTVEVE